MPRRRDTIDSFRIREGFGRDSGGIREVSILRFQLLPHAYQVALRIMKKRVSTEVANLHHGHHLCATSLLHNRHQGLYGINPNDDDCSLGLRVSLRDAAIDGAWTRSHVLARRVAIERSRLCPSCSTLHNPPPLSR